MNRKSLYYVLAFFVLSLAGPVTAEAICQACKYIPAVGTICVFLTDNGEYCGPGKVQCDDQGNPCYLSGDDCITTCPKGPFDPLSIDLVEDPDSSYRAQCNTSSLDHGASPGVDRGLNREVAEPPLPDKADAN